jgi:hypothetical protein
MSGHVWQISVYFGSFWRDSVPLSGACMDSAEEAVAKGFLEGWVWLKKSGNRFFIRK